MHLLQLDQGGKLSLVKHDTDNLPPYTILSHTWGADTDELTFQDVTAGLGQDKSGFVKVRFCGEQAKKDGYQYFWVDSCCIDKTSSSELSEAIISMFRWYKRAAKCYVYLQDVSTRKRDSSGESEGMWETAFRNSRWFSRGWTLQELLAPKLVSFFSRDGDLLGNKTTLEALISTITGIPIQALRGAPLSDFAPNERFRWAAARQTKRKEDRAYCPLGIFNIFLQPLYGEEEHAFRRLQEAIDSRRNQLDAHPTGTYSSDVHSVEHEAASTALGASPRERRKALMTSLAFEQMNARRSTIRDAQITTCQWFLEHPSYIAWNDPAKPPRTQDILWINGKPGTGKSTLMKFAQTQARKRNKKCPKEILLSFFFNARGHELEKTTVGMYRSLLHQLLNDIPDLQSVLDEVDTAALTRHLPSLWTIEVLQTIFTAAVADLGERRLKCFIDALDECNEPQIRDMVTLFEDLGESALEGGTQLCICFASRHYSEIRVNKALKMVLEEEAGHSTDIEKFIRRQLEAGDREADERVRTKIKEKSNRVFMWVVLVVEILNAEYRGGRMWAVEGKLEQIPEKLSDLFKNMLRRDRVHMDDLLLCLQWILFAKRPLSPQEFYLAMEAGIHHARPGPWCPQTVTGDHVARFVVGSSKGLAELTKSEKPTVQFIHESVRDFLIKDNGLGELWPHLNGKLESSGHEQLKLCCRRYLTVDLSEFASLIQDLPKPSSSDGIKQLRNDVSSRFPFLEYASQEVLYHANEAVKDMPQVTFLENFPFSDWKIIANIFQRCEKRYLSPEITLLYVLAESNLARLMSATSMHDRWDRISDARYGYPFLAAFANGNQAALEILLNELGPLTMENLAKDHGFGRASELHSEEDVLIWAARNQSWFLTEYLLTSCQDRRLFTINSKFGQAKNRDALYFAAVHGPAATVERLVGLGAGVEKATRSSELALLGASEGGRDDMVRVLLENCTNIDPRSTLYANSLCRASARGHSKVVEILLEREVDVDAHDDSNCSAL